MSGIEAEVIEGFKALPKRGAEIGGALLGRRGPRGEFLIESWRPIPIEHRAGPSYILSEFDMSQWAEVVNRNRKGVPARGEPGVREPESEENGFIGIYRSQTRPGLAVTAEDCAIVEKFLPREDGILLIVKPLSISESVATFYLCEGGAIVDAAAESREFEFGGKAIPPSEPVETTPAFEPWEAPRTTTAQVAASHIAGVQPPPASLVKFVELARRWRSFLLPASAVIAGAALGFYAHSHPASEDPVRAAVVSDNPATGLNLRAERTADGVRLTWNPQSQALADAVEGVLLVDDSGARTQERLGPADLRAGSISWRPASSQTEFELRIVTGGGREYFESIRVLRPVQ